MVEKLQQIQNVLQNIVAAGTELKNNGALQIYSNLKNELQKYKNMADFFACFEIVAKEMQRLLSLCNKVDDKQTNLNVIADVLVSELKPRFVKETHHDSKISFQKHIENWLISNEALDCEQDQNLVFAGFLAIFYL